MAHYSSSRPWYSNRRTRPTVGERDSLFQERLREPRREREHIVTGNGGSDNDENENEQPEVPETDLSTKLHVTNLDLNISENTKLNHTDMYECTEVRGHKEAELVVRRGQPFLLTITFDRPYDIDKNDITLMLSLVKVMTLKIDTLETLKTAIGRTYTCSVLASVKESDSTVKTSERVNVRNPPLDITGPETCKKEGEVTATVSFTNSMKVPLTNCKLSVEGSMKCVDKTQEDMDIGTIGAGKTWSVKMLLKMSKVPEKRPMRFINMVLSSEEITDVTGIYTVQLI